MAQLSERVEENMKRFSRKENGIESNTVPGSRLDQGKAFDTGSNILRTSWGGRPSYCRLVLYRVKAA